MFERLEELAEIFCQQTNLIFVEYMEGIYNGLQNDPDFDLEDILNILIRDHEDAIKALKKANK